MINGPRLMLEIDAKKFIYAIGFLNDVLSNDQIQYYLKY